MKNEIVPYTLQPGYMIARYGEGAVRTVLGSCVSVCISARGGFFGCINHFLYPRTGDRKNATAMYGNVATISLVKMAFDEGYGSRDLEAQIFGGAYPSGARGRDIGRENVSVAEAVLKKKNISVVSRDVGGQLGRKIVFDISTGHVAVIKVKQLRHSDWPEEIW
ncbi:MAG: chemotaxis protein CheD [Fibrobacterota bacterium]